MLPVKLGILPKRSNGLGGEVKGRWSGKQDCRQGKAVEIPVWVCLTAPTGGVASGFLRHWTGPASSTREFQGFNINLKTTSSDMVHGLTQSLHGYEQLKLRDPSHSSVSCLGLDLHRILHPDTPGGENSCSRRLEGCSDILVLGNGCKRRILKKKTPVRPYVTLLMTLTRKEYVHKFFR